jgi:hypothetical protein
MKKRWYCIGADDDMTSWNDRAEKAEHFATRAAALARATVLAKDIPHIAYFICEAIEFVVVETKAPRLGMAT